MNKRFSKNFETGLVKLSTGLHAVVTQNGRSTIYAYPVDTDLRFVVE